MKKILFISTTLGGGGAERIISYLLNEFAQDYDKKVFLLLLRNTNNTYLEYVSPSIEIINLNIKGRIRYAIFLILKTIIKIKPNICYIGLDKLNIMLSFFLPLLKLWKIRFIVRETNVLSQQYNYKNPFIKLSYKLFYNLYDSIIAQSKDMANDLIKIWSIKKRKITLINNPINIENVIKKSNEKNPSFNLNKKEGKINLIAIGRLSYQKGYDILIQRIYELKPNIPFNLYILGEGELRPFIEQEISNLGLKSDIRLLGFQKNPYNILKQMDGIILSSRHEGFPNVLLEANALGIPILANRCSGGINEIIKEGINGISCFFESKDSFQKGLNIFLNTQFNSEEIKKLTQERYDLSVILPLYRAVFDKEL